MQKSADINDLIGGIGAKAREAGAGLSNWYENVNPDVKRTLLSGALGAGLGAGVSGLAASRAHKADPDHGPNVKSEALLGALLGGTAGAGLPLGLKMLGGGGSFSGESHKPLLSQVGNKAIDTALLHPGVTIGTAAGASMPLNRAAYSQFMDALRTTKDSGKNIGDRIAHALSTMNENRDISAALGDSGVIGPKLRTLIEPEAHGHALQDLLSKLPKEIKNIEHTNPATYLQHVEQLKGSVKPTGEHLAQALKALAAKRGVGKGGVVGSGRLAMIPAAAGAGWLADRYLKGEY